MRKCPPPLRDDALQAAWVAYLEGRIKPDSAVRQVMRHEIKHNAIELIGDAINPESLPARCRPANSAKPTPKRA